MFGFVLPIPKLPFSSIKLTVQISGSSIDFASQRKISGLPIGVRRVPKRFNDDCTDIVDGSSDFTGQFT